MRKDAFDSTRAAVAVLLVTASLVSPQITFAETKVLDRITFTFGGFASSIDTKVRADLNDRELGTEIDFEDDLNLRAADDVSRFSFSYLFGKRHQVNLGFYSIDRTSTVTLSREITFRDRVFEASADIGGFFDTDITEFSYTYWVISRDRMALGVTVGGVQFELGSGLGLVANDGIIGIDTEVKTDLPVPLFGIEWRRAVGRKLVFRLMGRFVTLSDIDDWSGTVIDLAVALEHRTFRNFGFGVAFNLFEIDLDLDRRLFTGKTEYSIDGIQLYGRVAF